MDEEQLENWIEEARIPRMMLDLEELDGLVRQELKMKPASSDMPSRILELFDDHKKILKRYGSYSIVVKQPKRAVRHIVNALIPPAFKKIIDKALIREKDLKKDYLKFYKYVDTVAKGAELYIPETRVDHSKTEVSRGKTTGKDSENHLFKSTQKSTQLRRKCWSCQGDHHLRLCPTASQQEKDSLIKSKSSFVAKSGASSFQGSSAQSKDKSVYKPSNLSFPSSSSSSVSSPNSGKPVVARSAIKTVDALKPARFLATINDVLEIPVLLDSGACETCIGEHHLQKIMKLGGNVIIKDLEKPFSLSLAFGKGAVIVEQSTLLNISVVTIAGKGIARNILTAVIPDDALDELIIGHEIMKFAGADPNPLFLARLMEQPVLDYIDVVSRNHGGISSLMATNIQEEESNLVEDNMVDIGSDTKDSITEAFAQMLDKASAAGLEAEFLPQMESLLEEFRDIWKLKLGNDPPVKVEPMKIVLKPDARPIMCKSRRYPPIHRAYMANHVNELVKFNLVFPNRNAAWASPLLIVPKPNSKTDFRMTVDVRRVNEQTIPTAWPMPNLEVVFQHLENTSVYASFDLFKGYWQLPLDPECQEYMSFMTYSGIFTPTRVIQGATGAVAFCQSAIRRFFEKCQIEKCCLFSLRVKWCGRIISEAGISQDPARIQALVSLSPPVSGADLQQFVCALNWMRTSLPDFAKVVAPLQSLLESVYGKAEKRTRRAVQKVVLKEVGWDTHHMACFEQCKSLLASSCTLAHPKEDHTLCVFADASLDFWGSVVTQIPQEQLQLLFAEQNHVPLAFLSGAFKGAPSRWPIIEKEAFAIVETCSRLDYLLLRSNGFHLFTDHRNLQYLFNPFADHPGLQRHTAARLQ